MDISTAKFRLYNKSPFFGTIIFNLPVEKTKEIKTVGVDGTKLYANEDFWSKLSDDEQLGILAHEISHLFLNHLGRKGARNDLAIEPTTGETVPLWNLASDFAANLIVADLMTHQTQDGSTVGGRKYLPKKCLYDEKYRDWSTEKIYENLKKRIPNLTLQQLAGMLSSSLGDKSKWGKKKGNSGEWKEMTARERAEARGKIKQLSQQAMEEQKSKGNVPTSLRRLFEELEPKEDWRKVLVEYLEPYVNDYNFARPDRRYLEEEFYLPDIKEGEKIDWLAIAIDTSGSISGREMNHFISEVKAILGSYDKVKIRLTFCDAKAVPFVELEEYKPEDIKPVGGGGTDFRPVFEMIEKEEGTPKALLYFTDMMGNFPSQAPPYDMVWVSTTGSQYNPPFGKLLEYNV